MCRLAAYLGPTIQLNQFLLKPSHSLIKQSWAPEEMQEAVLNADGFGIGWYTSNGKACTYLNTLPIWSDVNLESLSQSLTSHLWLANVRSATPGQMTGLSNTQPFVRNGLMFMHNGFIENFNNEVRKQFHELLSAEIQSEISGNTDSEYIFALIRFYLSDNPDDIETAVKQALNKLQTIAGGNTVLLNMIISNGTELFAVRHAFNKQCPSLYITDIDNNYPGAILLASERLTDKTVWKTLPEHSLAVITQGKSPEIKQL